MTPEASTDLGPFSGGAAAGAVKCFVILYEAGDPLCGTPGLVANLANARPGSSGPARAVVRLVSFAAQCTGRRSQSD